MYDESYVDYNSKKRHKNQNFPQSTSPWKSRAVCYWRKIVHIFVSTKSYWWRRCWHRNYRSTSDHNIWNIAAKLTALKTVTLDLMDWAWPQNCDSKKLARFTIVELDTSTALPHYDVTWHLSTSIRFSIVHRPVWENKSTMNFHFKIFYATNCEYSNFVDSFIVV